MGVVYKAEDTRLHRTVALKFLPQETFGSEERKTRFVHEAQTAASLSHPNIATIYEYDEVEDPTTKGKRFLIAMEYVEGETLKARISRGSLSISKTLATIIQIVRGLEIAHTHGIVHRDLKPANIIIANDGTAKILDFGIAKQTGEPGVTKSGNIVGSVAYMSPEQIVGESVDERSDIWSLGVVIFEMLTQKFPFQGEHSAALMYSIANEAPLELTQFRDDVPKHLQILCKRCLEKDKMKRPQSMLEVLDILGETLSVGLPTSVAWHRRMVSRRLATIVSGSILLAILIWLFLPKMFPPPGPEVGTMCRIGILRFQISSNQKEISDWPKNVQAIFVNELGVFKEFRVYDPLSLNSFIESSSVMPEPQRSDKWYDFVQNAGIRLIVDGNIIKSRDGYSIRLELKDPNSRGITHTSSATAKGEEDLPLAIRTLSEEIIGYIDVKILHSKERDLEPWFQQRRPNMRALKAFRQAYENIFRNEPWATYCQQAIEYDSTFVSPRIWLISKLVQRGKMKEAKEHYTYLQKLEPSANPFEQAMIKWADAFIRDDTTAQARSLQSALEYSPGNNILLYNLARDHFIMQDYQGAVKDLEPAIETKWQYSPAHYLLGTAYNKLKKYNEAREVLEQALSVKPVWPETYGLLSTLSYRNHDTTKALNYEKRFEQRGQEQGDSLWKIYAALAGLNLEEELYDNAARLYREAIFLKPTFAEYHGELADILYKVGDVDGAKDECVKTLQLDSMWINAYFTLAQIFEQTGDTVQALSHYRAYLRKDSTSSKAETIKHRLSILNR